MNHDLTYIKNTKQKSVHFFENGHFENFTKCPKLKSCKKFFKPRKYILLIIVLQTLDTKHGNKI